MYLTAGVTETYLSAGFTEMYLIAGATEYVATAGLTSTCFAVWPVAYEVGTTALERDGAATDKVE
jgi:hypothetical protein